MKKFFSEFKAFALKGNVVDMAVGVIIGGAFGAIVSSLINDIIMPLLGLLIKVDFNSWGVVLGDNPENLAPGAAAEAGLTVFYYGKFISAIVYFILIALAIFIVIRALRKAEEKAKKKEEPAPEKKPRLCPYCKQEVADDATRCPHCTSELPKE
ncbi:MAG: large conductance mechanosensitive channel protein MscL [Clostridia bacterium]|nr:large conductance mechanosensitive channel protein MscL [Clostridia bacterium]